MSRCTFQVIFLWFSVCTVGPYYGIESTRTDKHAIQDNETIARVLI